MAHVIAAGFGDDELRGLVKGTVAEQFAGLDKRLDAVERDVRTAEDDAEAALWAGFEEWREARRGDDSR